jgi:hypothetical protein
VDEVVDMSSTSKWPFELRMPFVVIEILRPTCSHSERRLERWRRSDIGGAFLEVARAWAKNRPRFPTPRIWIRRASEVDSSIL